MALDEKAEDTKHDMGGDIAPYFAARNEAGVYDFNSNEIPGATPTDHAYWRDAGTLKQFYDAHMDLISYVPEFNLYNTEWPIYTLSGNLPPAKFVHAGRDRLGHATDSIVSPGVIVSGGEVHHSVLSPNVRIHSWSQVVDSILFDGVTINRRARVYKAILDKNVVLTENSTVGIDTNMIWPVASPSRRKASPWCRRYRGRRLTFCRTQNKSVLPGVGSTLFLCHFFLMMISNQISSKSVLQKNSATNMQFRCGINISAISG